MWCNLAMRWLHLQQIMLPRQRPQPDTPQSQPRLCISLSNLVHIRQSQALTQRTDGVGLPPRSRLFRFQGLEELHSKKAQCRVKVQLLLLQVPLACRTQTGSRKLDPCRHTLVLSINPRLVPVQWKSLSMVHLAGRKILKTIPRQNRRHHALVQRQRATGVLASYSTNRRYWTPGQIRSTSVCTLSALLSRRQKPWTAPKATRLIFQRDRCRRF